LEEVSTRNSKKTIETQLSENFGENGVIVSLKTEKVPSSGLGTNSKQ